MKKIKYLLSLCFMFSLLACDRQPYVEHKINVEKIAENCSEINTAIKLTSNFGGDRFEFQKCLPENYTAEIISRREGDAVIIEFPEKSGENLKLYQVTLDIDTYPAYHSITIDGESVGVKNPGN